MSLQVKFPYGRSQGVLYKCSECSFSTRHRVLYERHRNRCVVAVKETSLPAAKVNRNYYCEQCGYGSNQSRKFLMHLKTTHKERFQIYVCNQCEYASKHRNKVFRHRRQVHKEPLPISNIKTINGDNEDEEDESEVSFKVTENTPEVPVQESPKKEVEGIMWKRGKEGRMICVCRACGFSSGQQWKVTQHVRVKHQQRQVHRCPHCSYATLNKIEWCIHKAKHTQLSHFDCSECGYKTHAKRNMQRHRAQHTTPASIKCTRCSFSSNSMKVIQRHENHHHPEPPPVPSKLHRPQTARKSVPVKRPRIETNSQPLDLCTRETTHASTDDDDISSMDTQPEFLSTFPCPFCDFSSASASEIQDHMRSHPLCNYCGQSFRNTNELTDHLQQYHNISTQHHGLDVGSVIAADDLMHCSFCDFNCKNKGDFGRHMMQHTGEKPYKCILCEYTSSWRGDMKKHLNRVHVDEIGEDNLESSLDATYKLIEDDPMKCLAALVGGDIEENNNTISSTDCTPVKMESCYSGGSWEVSPEDPNKTLFRKYRCVHCGRRSNWSHDIRRHVNDVHGKDPSKGVEEMDEEEAKATIQEYLTKHHDSKQKVPRLQNALKKGMYRRYKCGECGKRSNWRWDLNKHIRTTHGTAEVIEMTEAEAEATFHEVFLGKKSPPKERMKAKETEASGNAMPAQSFYGKKSEARPVEKAKSAQKKFGCTECSFRSNHRKAVIRHKRVKHPLSQPLKVLTPTTVSYELWECIRCDFGCSKKSLVYQHIEETHMEAIYACKICGEAFKDKESCISHIEQCHMVDMEESYVEPALLTKSVSVGVVLWECSFCKIQCTDRTALLYHAAEDHPEEDPETIVIECNGRGKAKAGKRKQVKEKVVEKTKEPELSPPALILTTPQKSPRKGGAPKFLCDKCPLVSFRLNAFMYHKQLHRHHPKRRKCQYCPFWAPSNKHLSRHRKCHAPEYISQNRPDLLMSFKKPEDLCVLPRLLSTPVKAPNLDMSVIDVARVKQQMIASRVASVPITPSKINDKKSGDLPKSAYMPGLVIGDDDRIISSGIYRKMHKCRFCPYTNVRIASLNMHEKMHGKREGKELYSCHHCSYSVGNKGLLNTHLRVHSQQYNPGLDSIGEGEQDEDAEMEEAEKEEAMEEKEDSKPSYDRDLSVEYDMNQLPQKSNYYIKFNERTKEHVLEKAIYKKWCCEKCPYATMKKTQFEKHALLHGSVQKYTCEFCDYSVPGYHLLLQHQKLHLSPNPNLLSVQSITNLTDLPTVPADIAAAANFDPESGDNHQSLKEHANLYENSSDFSEPKKQFCCDKCPYSNPRRDMLLSHMKFHLLKSEMKCPYCDYSVSKVHLLNQHIKLHFNIPGSEMNADGEIDNSFPLPQISPVMDEGEEMRAAYAAEETEDLECNFCGRDFTDMKKYQLHVSQHLASVPTFK